MEKLPDEKTLLELLEMAKIAAKKAQTMSDLATEIDEKWRIRLESRRVASRQKK